MIRHNLSYKLLALVVSLTLWFYVNSVRNPQSVKTFTVPVEVHNVSKGYVAESRTPEATVSVTGLKSVVDSIRREDVIAWVDMTGVKTNKNAAQRILGVNTRILGVSSDEGVTHTATPDTALVAVEAVTRKRLPIEVKFTTAPPPGYSYGEPVLSPQGASVWGKATDVAKVRRVVLNLPSQESGPVDDYFDLAALDVAGRSVSGVGMEPVKVRLKLDFVQEPQTKSVIVSPDVTGEPRFPYRVSKVVVTPSTITLEGSPTDLMGISTVTTDRVSLEGAVSKVSAQVALRLPSGVDVMGQAKVRVTVYLDQNN